MTNNDSFYESWLNVSHKVLGCKLQPLSLNHLLFLYQIESPVVYTSKPITLKDLEIAVLVCSSKSTEEILDKIKPSNYLNPFQILQRYLWLRKNKHRNFEEESLKFISYYSDYCSLPVMLETEGETNQAIPFQLVHAANLIKNTGWSESTVFSMSVGKVIWLNLAFGYLKSGETNVMSDKELEAVKMLKG